MSRHVKARRTANASWFTRARALLAGGLVLGVGAAMTYASWTDTEFASGSFSASTFNIESSIDGINWVDNATSPGATLAFDAAGMSPTDVRSASIGIRTKAKSVEGTITLGAPTVTKPGTAPFLADSLTYRVYRSTDATCTATSAPALSTDWIVGKADTYVALNTLVSPAITVAAATGSGPGAATYFCFQVTLPSGALNALQGSTTSVTWQFTAVSH
jgi:predicted ribosomally synthesized peptide with SipW-like signal peptide